ncbi:hypothetical protein GUJ93_ZPchr0013g35525 [Zizania palustris]|uniref:Uncharacterized protein n=1 Tax=Zizania palustris TaxID=103762 RepID=A0A8J6BWY5_ZIZPA|nr:hypothetical protein GUJ93_ZPchr0013g35525 [Zizania palustris]
MAMVIRVIQIRDLQAPAQQNDLHGHLTQAPVHLEDMQDPLLDPRLPQALARQEDVQGPLQDAWQAPKLGAQPAIVASPAPSPLRPSLLALPSSKTP